MSQALSIQSDESLAPSAPPTLTTANQDADLLREFLARHDAPCPMCGYSLKGLASTACPECGSTIVLQVKPAEPRMGWWTTGLIGLSSGFGFFLVVSGFLMWAIIVEGPSLNDLLNTWPIWLGLALSGAVIGAWVRFSTRIRRFGTRTRISLAIFTWFFSAVMTISFLWLTLAMLF